MRPLRIKLQAFGPYPRSVEIDFRSLETGGLFLIHGQTGAGKTSILDGICFALFGTSSGSDRTGEGMRSDLALSLTPTEVVFEFAIGKQIYRVIRRPRQMLKRQRGEGLTQALPKGELWKLASSLTSIDLDLNEAWTLEASGDKKTDSRISELMGMSEEQFRQVVVLPQGQFRKFLSASSDARESLLEALFRTEKYRRLADFLQKKAQTLASQVQEERNHFAAHLSSLSVKSLLELDRQLLELADTQKTLSASKSEVETRAEIALARLQKAQQFAKAKSELAELKTQATVLNQEAPKMATLKLALEEDRRSRPVLAIDQLVLQLKNDILRLEGNQRHEIDRKVLIEQTLVEALSKRRGLESRQDDIEKLKIEKQSLGEMWKVANRLKTEQAGLRLQESQLKSSEIKMLEQDSLLANTKRRRSQLVDSIQSFESRASSYDALKGQYQLIEVEVSGFKGELHDFEQSQSQLKTAESFFSDATQAALARRDSLKQVKLNYHLSQAARLALELKVDEPCPVCGSKTHPQPAAQELNDNDANPDSIVSAEKELERASAVAAQTEERVKSAGDSARKNLDRLFARGVKSHDPIASARHALSELDLKLKDLKMQISKAEAAGLELRNAKSQLKVIEKDLADQEAKSISARQSLEDLRVQFAAAQSRVSELLNNLPTELRELNVIEARGQVVAKEIDAFSKDYQSAVAAHEAGLQSKASIEANLHTLNSELATRLAAHQKQTDALQIALNNSGFKELSACRAANLNADQAKLAEDSLRKFESEKAINDSRMKDLETELKKAPDLELDLAACERDYRAADAERTDRLGRLLAIEERIRLLTASLVNMTKLAGTIEEHETRYHVLGKIGAVAAGQPPHNLSRVNFPRFVLASRLDDVLELASRRLSLMSRGQFKLVRASGQEDKRRTAGLELEVEDSYSGSRRPTSSLSGGEGFMASLCLALGLADVVQSELGGIRLDAVFVDEGFGSLDSEALELAMKSLSELQAGGRMVGIISHVPDLKEQISRRLWVRKTPEGSAISWENT